MTQKRKTLTANIPIELITKAPIKKRKLEDCEPGATREEVLQFIEKVSTSPKTSQKHGKPPVLA